MATLNFNLWQFYKLALTMLFRLYIDRPSMQIQNSHNTKKTCTLNRCEVFFGESSFEQQRGSSSPARIQLGTAKHSHRIIESRMHSRTPCENPLYVYTSLPTHKTSSSFSIANVSSSRQQVWRSRRRRTKCTQVEKKFPPNFIYRNLRSREVVGSGWLSGFGDVLCAGEAIPGTKCDKEWSGIRKKRARTVTKQDHDDGYSRYIQNSISISND